MSDYIKREDAYQAIADNNYSAELTLSRYDHILESIGAIPAADVREVVFCKRCRYWQHDRMSCEGLARCLTGECGVRFRAPNDFCSRGAEMEEETK